MAIQHYTVVNDVYQYNIMIVIDDTLSKINDYHRMCVHGACACLYECYELEKAEIRFQLFRAQDTKRTYKHTSYLTLSAQVDFIYVFCLFVCVREWTG